MNRNRHAANDKDDWKYTLEQGSEHSVSPEHHCLKVMICHEVQACYLSCLQNLNLPIVKVKAQHRGYGKIASSIITDGLEREVYYCKGANIQITRIVWQTAGLCNVAIGKIIVIVYHDNILPPSFPKSVIVDFDMDYIGPECFPKSNPESPDARCPKRGGGPIFPEQSE